MAAPSQWGASSQMPAGTGVKPDGPLRRLFTSVGVAVPDHAATESTEQQRSGLLPGPQFSSQSPQQHSTEYAVVRQWGFQVKLTVLPPKWAASPAPTIDSPPPGESPEARAASGAATPGCTLEVAATLRALVPVWTAGSVDAALRMAQRAETYAIYEHDWSLRPQVQPGSSQCPCVGAALGYSMPIT